MLTNIGWKEESLGVASRQGRLELELVKFAVDAAAAEQLGVGALLGDAAVFQDDDEVGFLNGGKAVGDADGGAALHEVVEGALDGALGFGVQRAGGFVEDEDGGVF